MIGIKVDEGAVQVGSNAIKVGEKTGEGVPWQ